MFIFKINTKKDPLFQYIFCHSAMLSGYFQCLIHHFVTFSMGKVNVNLSNNRETNGMKMNTLLIEIAKI